MRRCTCELPPAHVLSLPSLACVVQARALLGAGMTVLTNPSLTISTWMPSLAMPRQREYVFLGCHRDVPRESCMRLCENWRNGTGLRCKFVTEKAPY